MENAHFMPFNLWSETNERAKKIDPGHHAKNADSELRELEEDGVIIRTVYNQVPPKVVYELSELGQSLRPVIDVMCEWGERYIQGSTEKQASSNM